MSKQYFEYKKYKGSIEFDLKNNILFGQVLFIRDLISYEADKLDELQEAFKEAVDDYLNDCEADGIEPNRSFSGTFQIRISPEDHERAAIAAYSRGESVNHWVGEAIEARLRADRVSSLVNIHHHHVSVQMFARFEMDDEPVWNLDVGKVTPLLQVAN